MKTLIDKPGKASFFSEPKNIASTVIVISLLAGTGYAFVTFILPFLISVTWSMINLIIGGSILVFLLMLLTSKKFWRALRYFSSFIADYTIGLAIELNPFAILAAKIEQGHTDRNTLYKQAAKLKGKQSELMEKLSLKEKELTLNVQKVKILQAENKNSRHIELYTNNVLRCQEYIDNVTPVAGDLNKLISFADVAYEEKWELCLKMQKLDLEAKKDLYYSVTTGLSAVSSAMKAFKGDDDLNRDAEKALAILKEQISEKIGHIKSAINVTSRFMDDKILEDRAKAAGAVALIKQFDMQSDFNYMQSSLHKNRNGDRLSEVTIPNRYNNLLD